MAFPPLYLGIDVGTGSARAGIFTPQGVMLASASHPIRMWKPQADYVEQSSEDIWAACCSAVRNALQQSGALADQIVGIGFDATCSLVALDRGDCPISLSPTGNPEQNIIVWMDHRAADQAARINATHHEVLRYVGGVISPEMQIPKLLWIKENLPAAWKSSARFFDLPDFLTYRATGDDTRSLCSVVCKWTYLGQNGLEGSGWDADFFREIGLEELVSEDFARIGQRIRPMGSALGNGLTARAAEELGLKEGTPVGVSIIDAHAGGLGLLAAPLEGDAQVEPSPEILESRLALIGGTSSCHMAVSREPRFIDGIWGPYASAMIPGFWLTEGGQSATGALVDHVIQSHATYPALKDQAAAEGKTVYELLNAHLASMAESENCHVAELTRDLHVQPDFHGNRSPRADATLRGTITGLPLSATLDDLARLYLAAVQAVAYGTRHILEEMNRKGYAINAIFICGGGTKNPLFLQQHADITGCRLILPAEPEAVLLGSAVLGAVASGTHPDIFHAMLALNKAGAVIPPAPEESAIAIYHNKKYKVFHRLHEDFLTYRALMS